MKPCYQSELGKLHNIDCLNFMQSLPENHIDLTVTSPPYDNLRSYKDGIGEAWNFDIFKPIARELFRVTKAGGVVVWIVADATIKGSETGTSFKQALYFKEWFNLHDTMIYNSKKPPLNHRRYEQAFEFMFVFSKGNPKTFNPILEKCIQFGKKTSKHTGRQDGDDLTARWGKLPTKHQKIKSNIWFYNTGNQKSTKDKIAFEHPAVFPEKLAADHMISWSNEGDLVFDPFMGSGTVAKQCEILNRRWLGCDIAEEYCEMAAKRIEETASQMKF